MSYFFHTKITKAQVSHWDKYVSLDTNQDGAISTDEIAITSDSALVFDFIVDAGEQNGQNETLLTKMVREMVLNPNLYQSFIRFKEIEKQRGQFVGPLHLTSNSEMATEHQEIHQEIDALNAKLGLNPGDIGYFYCNPTLRINYSSTQEKDKSASYRVFKYIKGHYSCFNPYETDEPAQVISLESVETINKESFIRSHELGHALYWEPFVRHFKIPPYDIDNRWFYEGFSEWLSEGGEQKVVTSIPTVLFCGDMRLDDWRFKMNSYNFSSDMTPF